MNQQTTTTARPRLANALQNAGYELKPTRSVWNPAQLVWEFKLDKTSADIVRRFYDQIGKPVPAAVQKFLQEEGAAYDEV